MALTPPRKPGTPRNGGVPGNVPPELETGKERLANEQLADIVASLEEELEELKVKYEMYFIGAERMEPARRRDDLKRNVARLMNAFTRNAGIRFRIQALHARYLSYERLWLRSAREKEAGTYRRDLLKARRRAVEGKVQAREGAAAGKASPAGGPTADEAGRPTPPAGSAEAAPAPGTAAPIPAATTPAPTPAIRPAAETPRPPPLPQRAAGTPVPGRPAPTPSPPSAMSEPELRALYDTFLAAKRSCNEDTSRFTFETLARTVNKQAPEIAAKFKAKRVEFKVAVRGGKAVLTAVPKT